MAKQTKSGAKKEKNKGKLEVPEIGQKAADKYVNSLSLEDLVKFNQASEPIDEGFKKGIGHNNPELRKQLGSLYHGNPYHFYGKTGDYIEDHFNYLYNNAKKKLAEKVDENIDSLIDKLDEKDLTQYLLSVGPSKAVKKTNPELAKAHLDFLNAAVAGQDAEKMIAYLAQYYKDDGLIQSQFGDDKMTQSIYNSTIKAKEQELLSYFTKIKEKDGKKTAELDKDFLKAYIRECAKGADEKIKPQIYKKIAYDAVK